MAGVGEQWAREDRIRRLRMDEDMDREYLEELTKREAEVMRLLKDPRGLTYKEVGEEMGISWMTVRFMAHAVYAKLGLGGFGARARLMMKPPLQPSQNQKGGNLGKDI